jgi:hypothetical protein
MADQGVAAGAGELSAAEVRELCGEILDWKLNAILALEPTAVDLEAALAWANRQDDLLEEGRPLGSVAASICDLLVSDEEFGEER